MGVDFPIYRSRKWLLETGHGHPRTLDDRIAAFKRKDWEKEGVSASLKKYY